MCLWIYQGGRFPHSLELSLIRWGVSMVHIKHNFLRSRLLDNFSHLVSWYKESLLEYAVNPVTIRAASSCNFSWCYQLPCSKQKWLHCPKMSLIVIPIFVHPICHKYLEQSRQRHQTLWNSWWGKKWKRTVLCSICKRQFKRKWEASCI
jgi:hypothetical protein